jgi:hypothetical protein
MKLRFVWRNTPAYGDIGHTITTRILQQWWEELPFGPEPDGEWRDVPIEAE